MAFSLRNGDPRRVSPIGGSPARGACSPETVVAADGSPDRKGVGELQRARIIAAISELAHERGPGAVTVAHIVERSGVSRRTFYEHFEDREACLLAAFEHAVQRATAAAAPAYAAAKGGWDGQVRAGLAALLELFDEEPVLGSLCVVDALAGQRPVLARRAQVMRALVTIVHGGARGRAGDSGRANDRIVAEGIVGAVFAIVHARLLASDRKPLLGLLNHLMSIVVLPYRGPAAAARELGRPVQRSRRRSAASRDPLRGLDMRLTYRTVRTLLAIAELGRPGAHPSSRAVGDAAGIGDQGQVSKLLWRLEHLGLIANEVRGPRSRGSNAWVLTARGHEVENAIRVQIGR